MIQVTKLHLHKRSQTLDVCFADGNEYSFSAEFLRVHSPSAEVQGHGQPKLVSNKKSVAIAALQRVGHYAVKLVFDDGHDSGIFSWSTLAQYGQQHDTMWQTYLDALKHANATRETVIPISLK